MKELNVHCNFYLKVSEPEEISEALDRLLMLLDSDLGINIHSYELQEN